MNRIKLLAPALVLLLAACGSETAEPPAAPATAEVVTANTEGTPGDMPTAAPSAATLAAIPAAFLGVWDAETGSCDPASDLRLEIAAQTIGFYESQGTVNRVVRNPDGWTVADLAMEGEGETWDMTMSLRLSGEGEARRLSVRHKGQTEADQRTLKPCPA